MSKAWRLQYVREELILDLINCPYLTIDDLIERYLTSKAKLYEYFREVYQTTPGVFRKRHRHLGLTAKKLYLNPFRVSFNNQITVVNPTDEMYLDPFYHKRDACLMRALTHVWAQVNGKQIAFETHGVLEEDVWVDVTSPRGEVSLAIRGRSDGQVEAFLSLGGRRGGQIALPYQLSLTITDQLVGYAGDYPTSAVPTTRPVPTALTLSPKDDVPEMDLETRSVYTLTLGAQTFMVGLYEPLGELEVGQLKSRWKRVGLNNDLRRKLRLAFHTNEYVDLTLAEAVAMQDRVVAVMDQFDGVVVCSFRKDFHTYLVRMDEAPDLADLTQVYAYMLEGPTRLPKDAVKNVALSRGAELVTMDQLVRLLRT